MLALKNLDALKCLVTASMASNSGLKLKAAFDESSNVTIAMEDNCEADHQRSQFTDPLAFSWYLSRNDNVYRSSEAVEAGTAEVLQWAFYSQSELNSHVQGM